MKVWDLETLVAEVSYPGAHAHWVSGVSAHPSQPQQLASCGLDGTLLLWDTRAARPARRKYSTHRRLGCFLFLFSWIYSILVVRSPGILVEVYYLY